MELVFNQVDKKFVAEFKAEGNFNLHMERAKGGKVVLYQKTYKDGDYAIIDKAYNLDGKEVIDLDMTALVYPKYIKVVCATKPTIAVVTTNAYEE